MDRKQKIEFLRGVMKSTRSINELMPYRTEDWFIDHNGMYYQPGSNERLSFNDLDRKQNLDPFTLRIIHISSPIPIAQTEEEVII